MNECVFFCTRMSGRCRHRGLPLSFEVSLPSATTKKALKVCTGEHAIICCRCEVHTWCWQTLVPLPHSHHWLLSLVKRIRKPVQLWTFSATRWQICIFTSWQAFVSAEICRLVPIRTAHDNMLLFSSLSLWFQVQMTPTDQWTNSSAMHRNVLCHATPRKSGGTASPPSYEELFFIGLQASGDTTLISEHLSNLLLQWRRYFTDCYVPE